MSEISVTRNSLSQECIEVMLLESVLRMNINEAFIIYFIKSVSECMTETLVIFLY